DLIKALIYALQRHKLEFEQGPWEEVQRAAENLRTAQNKYKRTFIRKREVVEEVQRAKARHDQAYQRAWKADLETWKAESEELGVFVTALSAMGKPAVAVLKVRLRKDESLLVRWVAARALGEIGADAKVAVPD